MKKLLIPTLLLSSLLLGGCLNPGPSTTNQPPTNQDTSTETRVYNNNEFSISFPASWDIIQPKDFTSDIPSETQVVLRNNLKNEDFTANINVIKHSFQTAKNSLDYGQEILNRQKNGLLNYRETKKEIVKRSIGGQSVDTYVVEFEAKLNQTDPILKFVQTFATKDNNGYTALGSYSQLENTIVINQVNQTIQSFQVN